MARKPFNADATCDICGFKGSAQAVGGHVSREHGEEIRAKVLSLINSKPEGMTVKDMAAETGWGTNRILRTAARLRKSGAAQTGPGRTWVSTSAPKRRGRPKGSKNKPKPKTQAPRQQPTQAEGARSGDVMSYINRSQNRMVREARNAAEAALIEAHRDEFVRTFVTLLAQRQLANANGDKLEKLAEALL